MQKIVVDDFDILVSGEDLAFAFEMENMPVASAFLLYDGRNCAILIVNNLTSYILTNIVPEVRQLLQTRNSMVIINQKEGEFLSGYDVEIRHVESIPFPDNLDDEMKETYRDLKLELNDPEFDALLAKIGILDDNQ